MREYSVDDGVAAGDSRSVSRRGLLGGAATLVTTALAGCSALPSGEESEPELGFEPAALPQSVVTDLPQRPSAYPGPVPDRLGEAHRERARALLEEVPSDPSVPNGRISQRLDEERESAVETLRVDPEDEQRPRDRLGYWRYARGSAAEVWGAYHAAAGEVDAETVASRREAIRRDLERFEVEWATPGADAVEAIAVGYELEELRRRCRRFLTPDGRFPEEPTASVFRVGSQVADLERARAALADLSGLHQAYRESAESTRSFRSELSLLSSRLRETVAVSREQVQPFLRGGANYSAFDRDIDGLPAAELFVRLHGLARRRIADAEEARHRGNDAQAVVASGQALVAIVALSTAVDAIREGKYGMPDSVGAVREHREAALSALEGTRLLEPEVLATLVAAPAWQGVDEDSYVFGEFTEERGEPGERDVIQLVGVFGATAHLARAVPEVVDRVGREVERVRDQ